jgi:hypothetical protein
MRCEDCHGTGMIAAREPDQRGRGVWWLPCLSCGGSGLQSCCEGMTGGACDVTNIPASAPDDSP